jgi:hypothetical protein
MGGPDCEGPEFVGEEGILQEYVGFGKGRWGTSQKKLLLGEHHCNRLSVMWVMECGWRWDPLVGSRPSEIKHTRWVILHSHHDYVSNRQQTNQGYGFGLLQVSLGGKC